jgi:L-erythro-3,5-diaminohexanoate dehydrogenase
MRNKGNPYGIHRVIDPMAEFPQVARRLDTSLPIYSNEILIHVNRINIDSTSFKQLCEISDHDPEKVKRRILDLVQEQGKLHNPVTNSGGMLVGSVAEIGKDYQGPLTLKVGEIIATLVSLTLTPLYLNDIQEVEMKTGQMRASGYAILFETGIACKLPSDLPERVALSVLDICGAPALVLRHVQEGDRVLFIGAGKSAKLSAAAIRREWGDRIKIDCLDVNAQALEEIRQLGFANEVYQADATKMETLHNSYDLVVNVTNVPGTEMTSIIAVREGGKVIFFGMGTSFTKVALGAEGIAKDATFIIGSGYARGHAELALTLVRENKVLREWFEKKYEM